MTTGSGTGEFFVTPSQITVDEEGSIYVQDGGNTRIVRFDASGEYVGSFGNDNTTGNEYVPVPTRARTRKTPRQ